MTPNDIEILIHYHVSSRVHERIDAPAVKQSIAEMVGDGLLIRTTDNPNVLATTERGKAHLLQLCALPYPTCKWLNSHGEVIEGQTNERT